MDEYSNNTNFENVEEEQAQEPTTSVNVTFTDEPKKKTASTGMKVLAVAEAGLAAVGIVTVVRGIKGWFGRRKARKLADKAEIEAAKAEPVMTNSAENQ